jgi:hypothetical protein
MKNLQKSLIIAAIASIAPSTGLLCSEKSTKTTEINFLKNISYLGGITFATGAVTTQTLKYTMNSLIISKKALIDACENKAFSTGEEAVMKSLNKSIYDCHKKIVTNLKLTGVSCIAIVAPMIIPAAVEAVQATKERIDFFSKIQGLEANPTESDEKESV